MRVRARRWGGGEPNDTGSMSAQLGTGEVFSSFFPSAWFFPDFIPVAAITNRYLRGSLIFIPAT